MKKYEIIRNAYLANGLAFMGFKYQKYKNDEGNIVFSFENSDNLQLAIKTMLDLKHGFMDK